MTPASESSTQSDHQLTQSTARAIATDFSSKYEQAASTTQPRHPSVLQELPVYGGVLGLFLCCVLVAFVVLYRRPSNVHSTFYLAGYLLPTGPGNGNYSPETYSIVQYLSD
ncbi:hypothetical protein MHYP_G00325160 [Metynnis hypsauchen]